MTGVPTYDPAVFASEERQQLYRNLAAAGASPELLQQLYALDVRESEQESTRVIRESMSITDRLEDYFKQLSTHLQNDLRSQLGDTNKMIGDLNVTTVALRDMFQFVGERLTGIEGEIADIKRTQEDQALDIASFKRSRQQSMERHDTNENRIDELSRQSRQQYEELEQQLRRFADDFNQDVARREHYVAGKSQEEKDIIATRMFAIIERWPEIERLLNDADTESDGTR